MKDESTAQFVHDVAHIACKSCGEKMNPWLFAPVDAMRNQPMAFSSVVRCEGCGLGHLNPLPKPDDIPAFYQLAQYYTHGTSHIPPVRASIADRLLTKIAWTFDRSEDFDPENIASHLPSGGSVCDLGCGSAKTLERFKALGFSVVGVDPDPVARESAAKLGIVVETGTAEILPQPLTGHQFDLVIMSHSLEHCRDVNAAIGNAYALTRPGGCCYIEAPNCASEHFESFTICSTMFDAPRHIHFFTPGALTHLARQAGFEVERSTFRGYVRNFSPAWRAWERTIADRMEQSGQPVTTRRHSYLASVKLLAKSLLHSPARKYDSMGVMLKRPAI